MEALAGDATSAGQQNVAFLSTLLLGDIERCLDILVETDRLPEAAFFARTYVPSQVARVVDLWRERSARTNVNTSLAPQPAHLDADTMPPDAVKRAPQPLKSTISSDERLFFAIAVG